MPQEPHEERAKAKRYDMEDEPLPGQKVSSMLLGKIREQLPITSERMKQLSQSINDAQLWMCLVVKVKTHVIKNNTA